MHAPGMRRPPASRRMPTFQPLGVASEYSLTRSARSLCADHGTRRLAAVRCDKHCNFFWKGPKLLERLYQLCCFTF